MTFSRAIGCFAVATLALSMNGLSTSNCAYAAKQARGAKVTKTENSEKEVLSILDSLKNAAIEGNAENMAALFSEDARYVDDSGAETTGRQALKKRFAEGLKNDKATGLKFNPEIFKQLDKNVAVSEGTVSRKDSEKESFLPSTRYLIVFVKKDSNWLISSATETPVTLRESDDYLDELSWLIGKWSTERNGARVDMKAQWLADKNFIYCRYEITKPDQPKTIEAQIIGWDPLLEAPISWNFDASGGYSKELWERKDKKWYIQSTGMQRTGSTTNATNIIARSGEDSFTWQSVNRSIDGVLSPDTVLLKVNRIKD